MTTPVVEHVPTVEDYDNQIAALDSELSGIQAERDSIAKQVAAAWNDAKQIASLQTRDSQLDMKQRGGAIRRQQLETERAQVVRNSQVERGESLRKDMYDRSKVIEGKQAQIAKLREQIDTINREISDLQPELTLVTNRFYMLFRSALQGNDPELRKSFQAITNKYQ